MANAIDSTTKVSPEVERNYNNVASSHDAPDTDNGYGKGEREADADPARLSDQEDESAGTKTSGGEQREKMKASHQQHRKTSRTFTDLDIPDWSLRPATFEERQRGEKSTETALPVNAHFWIQEWKVIAADGHEYNKVKFRMQIKWTDYRLANWSLEEDVPENIWRPEMFFVGEGGISIPDSELQKPPTFAARDRNDGVLLWEIYTELAQFEVLASADGLRSFPFDSSRYDFIVCLSGEKRLEGSNEVKFDFEKSCVENFDIPVSDPQKCTSGDFELKGVSYAKGGHSSMANPTGYEDLLISLHVKRNPKFYLFKTCFPLYAILIFGALSYCLEVSDLSGRLNLIFAMFLTCFALQWIVLDRLPRVPYMTVLDTIISLVNASLLLMGVGSAVVAIILSRDRFPLISSTNSNLESDTSSAAVELAAQVETKTVNYSVSQVRLADQVDRIFQILVLVLFFGLHLYVVYGVKAARKIYRKKTVLVYYLSSCSNDSITNLLCMTENSLPCMASSSEKANKIEASTGVSSGMTGVSLFLFPHNYY
ncbi:unnamed protein product [Amoebophrya sp. A120]|nr:unnamed protein product [Amoebophrya sp. A120]|eukprot:GSA120T00019166001.1